MIIEVDKKYFIAIMATILVLAGTFFVVSYNSVPANPAVFGHSANELNLSGVCNSNGTGCLGTLVPVYRVNSGCTGAGSLTTQSTCKTRACGIYNSNFGLVAKFYLCGTVTNPAYCSQYAQETQCDNFPIGQMFINQTA